MTKQEQLARIARYSTKYELAATNNTTGEKVLVGYTRKGRNGLFASITRHADAAVRFFGCEAITFAKRAADGATMGEWSIKFSGRTQRDAIIEGELPFFLTLLCEKESAARG